MNTIEGKLLWTKKEYKTNKKTKHTRAMRHYICWKTKLHKEIECKLTEIKSIVNTIYCQDMNLNRIQRVDAMEMNGIRQACDTKGMC